MTLLDAYGLVAFIAGEAAADDVEALLRKGGCRVMVANLGEAVDVCRRVHGLPGARIREVVEPLFVAEILEPVASEEETAWAAVEIRSSFYAKDRRLSVADCFLLAHAVGTGDAVATSDSPVASVARESGLDVVALPDSSGVRP